jgi:succinate dehydrogenase / fumarate reductase flavoprotein subunit
MGGIDIADYQTCATVIPGIFAAGECACVSVHGANRLGGNALSEVLVFGKIAGIAAAEFAARNAANSDRPLIAAARRWREYCEATAKRPSGLSIIQIRNSMAQVMWDNAGITRNDKGLRQALAELDTLIEEYRSVGVSDPRQAGNISFVHYTEVGNMLSIAKAITLGALNRTETRGCHSRSDYPEPDNANFLKHTVVARTGDAFTVGYSSVNLTKLFPQGVP